MERNCPSGFHMSLGEHLSSRLRPTKCSICGRNYAEEDFRSACVGLGISPSLIDPFMYPERNNKEEHPKGDQHERDE